MVSDHSEENIGYHDLADYTGPKKRCACCWRDFVIGDVVFVSEHGDIFCPENEKMCIWDWAFLGNDVGDFRPMKYKSNGQSMARG